jgi:hypothetical protein
MSDQTHDEFIYRYPQNVFGHIPGAHAGSSLGSGDRFAGFADLFDYPDPRRLDIRASIRSSMAEARNRWLVRRYQQRSSITLWLLGDMSKSMTISSVNHDKLANLAQLIAHSAISLGDRFAMAGFDSDWRQDVSIMPTTQRSMPLHAAELIRNAKSAQFPGIDGLAHAANLVTSSHAMVFLASDFCVDISLVEKTLRQLSHYTVIPVVWQHHDVDHFPSHAGWTEMRDSETGQRRSIWMRPSMKKRWQQSMIEHFNQLDACFMHHRVRPLFVDGDVTGEQLTQYFLGLKRA